MNEAATPETRRVVDLFAMYAAHPDEPTLALLDAAVDEFRWKAAKEQGG